MGNKKSDKDTRESELSLVKEINKNDLLRLKLTKQGYDLRKSELALEREIAIEKAAGDEKLIADLNEEYSLKMQILILENQREKAANLNAAAAERQAAADAKREETALRDIDRLRTIQDLELETQYSGIELERARLELAKGRAIEEGKALGLSLALIEKEYDLRNKILDAQAAAESVGSEDAIDKLTARGQFGAQSASGAFGAGNINRLEKSNEEIAKNTKEIYKSIANGRPITFN
jgi:hypothetical protein